MLPTDTEAKRQAFDRMLGYHTERLAEAERRRSDHTRRHVGLELKFPVVMATGGAAEGDVISVFWRILAEKGWEPIHDSHVPRIIGACSRDDNGPDVLSTTTGICVLEFAVSHRCNLFDLHSRLEELAQVAGILADRTGAHLLGLGIQPVTPPGANLRTSKGRHLFWDQVLPPRRDTPHGYEGTVDLFTVIADSQVHVDVTAHEATEAVNVLNGLAGVQLAMTANSTVWRGEVDYHHVAVRELFWDWWLGGGARHGVPERPFEDLADYVRATAELKPVSVKRGDQHLGICHYPSFLEYFSTASATGITPESEEVALAPETDDIDLHDRAFWWDARLSRFGTIENRVSCQQPPSALLSPAALVLGIVENMDEARDLVSAYSWDQLRQLRVEAAHLGLRAQIGGDPVASLAQSVLELAEEGLRGRGLGEEFFLGPLWERCCRREGAARQARTAFLLGGIDKLIEDFAWA